MNNKITTTQLSVNVNKIATLRNARGGDYPNLITYTKHILAAGAHGITIHPRCDQRHITTKDVYELAAHLHPLKKEIEFNIEGRPEKSSADCRYTQLIAECRPHQATLVPDAPGAITSNAGWRIIENRDYLQSVFSRLRPLVDRLSLFVDIYHLNEDDLRFLRDENVQRLELYTETFAHNYTNSKIIQDYKNKAEMILSYGLELNAGHDLNLKNLPILLHHIPEIKEVSIGHALICESLLYSLPTTIQKYLEILKDPNGQVHHPLQST